MFVLLLDCEELDELDHESHCSGDLSAEESTTVIYGVSCRSYMEFPLVE